LSVFQRVRAAALARGSRFLNKYPLPAIGPRTVAGARVVCVMGAVVAADQLAKAAITASLGPRESLHLFFAVDLTNIQNTGVAFGIFAGLGTPVVLLSSLALLVPLVYFLKNPTQPLLWLPVGMIFGGALGNLADRERAGAVIDFIAISIWPAFNIADACIVLGVIGLLYAIERSSRRRPAR
jgi:signal peptidase II